MGDIEEIYLNSGYPQPKDKFEYSAKQFDYWDMIAFAEYVREKLNYVIQQRELLEWLSNEDYFKIPKDEIIEILQDWQTYKSNCD